MAPRNDITAREVALSTLLDGISEGSVLLPDFQRDFLWDDDEVVALVATVLSDWPAGSLLLMRGEPKFFAARPFEDVARRAPVAQYVVLDGQQRLTALHRTLRGTGPQVYALSYGALSASEPIPVEALEAAIKWIDRETWDQEFDLASQAQASLLPLYALSSAADFYDWRDSIVERASPGIRPRLADDLSMLYRNLLGNVNHYDFPCVILDHELDDEAVARIFERINRSGTRLNTFDLLVARAYAPDWNLRTRWNTAVEDSPLIGSFLERDGGLPILQLIALKHLRDVRQPAMLRLTRSQIQEGWNEAVRAMDAAIEVAISFGASHPDALPYKAMLLTLGGIMWSRPNVDRRLLERWFWGAALSGSYDVGSSTKVVADLRMLEQLSDSAGELPIPTVSREQAVAATRKSRPALWRAVNALFVRGHAKDPVTAEPVDPSTGTLVSIFPKDLASDLDRRVLSFVAVDKSSARQTRGSLLTALAGVDPASAESVVESQYLPGDFPNVVLRPDLFMRARLARILEILESSLGAPVATLESTDDGTRTAPQ